MAAGFSNILGAHGAVESVAGFIEADPRRADRGARSGRDAKFARDVGDLGPVFGVEGVVGVSNQGDDVKRTDGAFFGLHCDGAVREEDVVIGRIKTQDDLFLEVDF